MGIPWASQSPQRFGMEAETVGYLLRRGRYGNFHDIEEIASFLRVDGQNFCPTDDISPCSCFEELWNELRVDCSDAGSGQEIFSVFNSVDWNVTEVREFHMNENEFVMELPDGVFGSVSFRFIALYSITKLSTVHETAFLQAKDVLESIIIQESNLENFPWGILPQLHNLGELRLDLNSLTELPALQSNTLEYLSVTGNHIPAIVPGWFLPNLKELQLGVNPISEIPIVFFDNLQSLEIYGCSLCSLEDVPWDTILQLASLTGLQLGGNFFTTVPTLQSNTLESLSLGGNQLSALQAGWAMPNLKHLHLGSNPISEFPIGFFDGFTSLQFFSCLGCHLGPTLHSGKLAFPSQALDDVDLGRNDIRFLETGAITGLTANTQLWLDDNLITKLPEASFGPILEILYGGAGQIHLDAMTPIERATLRPIVYDEFLQGHPARAAADNICAAFEGNIVYYSTVSRWFERLESGDTTFGDGPHLGRPSTVDDEALRNALNSKPNATTRESATTLGPYDLPIIVDDHDGNTSLAHILLPYELIATADD
ncbi:unnamed protein product [Darwinula stevensoni]|uniref:Mos1 transposase HTH domain-containing protein n=1 Tax=Darwinula stevensoni TaxID=69355 RepID=A0A7R8X1W7_9CRUS|nr:unnamed protein product [Darwinula stevensoni]CAG0883260.1 unnamed protein product [Darwinula stevensoni]